MENQVDIYNTPALEAPQGETSNLVDPYSTHRYLVVTSAVCLVLSLSAIAARIFTKVHILRKMQIEDCKFPQHLAHPQYRLTKHRFTHLHRSESNTWSG